MLELLQRFFKKKYFIVIIAISIIFGISGETYNLLILNRQKSMIIEFNYPGAENGLNPDGSIFEISNLKSDEVINRAKEQLQDKNVDTEFLKSRIFITSKISGSSMDKIVSDVNHEKNIVYIPTTFYVYYSQKNKFSRNESKLFMRSLADAYEDYFNEKYSEKNDVLIYKTDSYDFSNADYHEIYTILSNKVDSMLDYIKTHQNENRAFYSQDRINLGMAAKKLESFRDINLEKFYSFMVQNSVSKDNSEYTKRVDYIIESKSIEYDKMHDSSDIAIAALDKYDPRITAVAFVPSVDSKNNYYMSRTKTGLDDLTNQSYNDGMSASRVLKDIEYYRSLNEKFSALECTLDDVKHEADIMINALSDELERISDEILKTDNEYLEHKTLNYLSIRLPKDNSAINLGLIIKCMFLGFIFALIAVIVTELFEDILIQKLRMLKTAVSAIEIINKNRR